MLHHIKKLFGFGPKEAPVAEVPYKVEAPESSSVASQASEAMVTSVAPAVEAKPAKKTAAKKTAAKKPRTPKAPK